MKKNSRKPESFITNPVYPGGKKALNDFVTSNLKYPEEALKNKIEGSVSLEYDVNVFGDVIATRVLHGIGYGCDEEACRIVSLLKFPKHKYKGLFVVFHLKINIHFKLHSASKIIPQQQNVVYNYVEKKKTEKPQQGYTIKINTGKTKN
jgi:TonB family protein